MAELPESKTQHRIRWGGPRLTPLFVRPSLRLQVHDAPRVTFLIESYGTLASKLI